MHAAVRDKAYEMLFERRTLVQMKLPTALRGNVSELCHDVVEDKRRALGIA